VKGALASRQVLDLTRDPLALFDRIASLTGTPDAAPDGLRELFADDALRVQETVFNVLRRRLGAI